MSGFDLPQALRRAAGATSLGDIDDVFAEVQRAPGLGADDLARAVAELVQVISERDLGDRERQTELRERYLLTALELPLRAAPELEAELLALLGDADPGPHPGPHWPARRRRLARAWMQVLERHATASAEHEDGDPPLVNPPAPEGLPGGAAPEAVSDPAKRADYEASIARHREQVEAHRRRQGERRLGQSLAGTLERRIVGAYAAPPPALDELAHDLDRELSNVAARRRILDAVRARS